MTTKPETKHFASMAEKRRFDMTTKPDTRPTPRTAVSDDPARCRLCGKYLDVDQQELERENQVLREQRNVCELFLCESAALVLKPNQLYLFVVHPDCDKCRTIESEGSIESTTAGGIKK